MRFSNRSTIAKGIFIISCLLGLFFPGQLSSSNREDLTILHIGTVAPNILGIAIQAGRVRYGEQVPYVQQAGDTAEKWIDPGWGWLKRNGRFIGARVGPKGDLLQTFDQVVGERLNTNWADKPKNYRIQSVDDPRYGKPLSPLAVYRKSKPSDLARTGPWEFDAPQEHVIYLKLPFPLTPGKNYQITSRENFLAEQSFLYEPAEIHSEAVHISQIGFRPDDPVKIAFLSCWLGNGGGVDYSKIGNFQVLNHNSGETVFEGKLHLSKAGRDQTEDPYQRNYNLVDVYEMDFSKLNQPGTYRVYVEGVGCSIPFQIGPKVWSEAFRIAAKSFYHQRSGIALGPPYTNFIRPRCFSPDDGVKVYASTCALIDSGNGLNAKGTDKDNFGNLVKGKTGELVPDAWGGYFDAGDWDRRIQHLDASRLLLELAELFPEFNDASSLNLPESGNGLPDLLNEALWNLDCYRRLQFSDGGIRGGIESSEHPQFGEASWQNSLPNMAYAPDPWSGYIYAGVAARAAILLKNRNPDLAGVYSKSALAAMNWSETEFKKTTSPKLPSEVNDARNLAALEMFRLTHDSAWHQIFLTTTVFASGPKKLFEWKDHNQGDAAFLYLRIDFPDLNKKIRQNCLDSLIQTADTALVTGQNTAFHWTKIDPWVPVSWNCLGVPQAIDLIRAHAVTGNEKYLTGVLLATQMSAGANPVNMCYTTGVGVNNPKHPLCVDARISHQSPPPGITVSGPQDLTLYKDHWAMKLISPYCYPHVSKWPATEAYFDVFWFPESCEFTIMSNLGPNTYVWGYLAARK